MNIDSSSVNSLLTSSGEGLEKPQETLQADGMVSEEFTNTLMEKIRQLSGADESSDLLENTGSQLLNNTEELQGLAGLFDENMMATEFSKLIGNSLPVEHKLEEGVDLEKTLEALSDTINTILEKVELIKTTDQGQVEKLSDIVEELKAIKLNIEDNLRLDDGEDQQVEQTSDSQIVKEDLTIQVNLEDDLNSVIEKMQQVAGFVSKENILVDAKATGEGEVNEVLDRKDLVNTDKDETLNVDLESEIETLTAELESVREAFIQKPVETINEIKQVINNPEESTEVTEEEENELDTINQIAALVSTMSEPMKVEKIAAETKVMTGQVLQNMKRDGVSIKQMPTEEMSDVSVDDEPSDLLQQDNKFSKSAQENLVIATKPNGKIDSPLLKEAELTTEKTLPKFATDLAMLNRAVIAENKTEIPPMTKHFSHPEWNKEMGERVIWMHKQEIPSAELRLNPKHLGPITIKIDVTQDQASVSFTAQHAVVKEAIEAALPKLKEMFSAQQLNLTDVNVSQQDSGQKQAKDQAQMGNGTGEGKNKESQAMLNNEQEKTMDIADEIEAGRAIASNGVLSIFA